VLREARLEGERVLAAARDEELQVRRDTEEARRYFSAYLAAYRQLLERALAEADALEAHHSDGSAPQ
jgi:hypothetical protein